jgi:hypothetical protein
MLPFQRNIFNFIIAKFLETITAAAPFLVTRSLALNEREFLPKSGENSLSQAELMKDSLNREETRTCSDSRSILRLEHFDSVAKNKTFPACRRPHPQSFEKSFVASRRPRVAFIALLMVLFN